MKNNLQGFKANLGAKVPAVIGAVATFGAVSSQAAGIDLTGVAFDKDSAIAVGTLVLVAAAAIWGVKKAISMANRG